MNAVEPSKKSIDRAGTLLRDWWDDGAADLDDLEAQRALLLVAD